MPAKSDPCTVSFFARVLQRHLTSMVQEMDGVREAGDIETIHRMRVASRRLRNAFALSTGFLPGDRAAIWLKQVRKVTRALGAARDTDVQLDLLQSFLQELKDPRHAPGIQRLALRLAQIRRQEQIPVIKALTALEKSGLVADMQKVLTRRQTTAEDEPCSHFLYHHASDAILSRLENVFSFEPYIHQPERVAELHAMRIATKWLRYTLETFAPLYPAKLEVEITTARKIQEMLGFIHDCDVWQEYLTSFEMEERDLMHAYYGHSRYMYKISRGLEFFRQDRLSQREKMYKSFLKSWEKWQEQGIWANLKQTLARPLIFGEVFPPTPSSPPENPHATTEINITP